MGTYVYVFSKTPAINATLPTGERVALHRFRYGCKRSLWDREEAEKYERKVTGRALDDFLKEDRTRTYAFIGDKPREGLPVYTHLTTAVYHDISDYPGFLVGWLKKSGRSWVVSTEYVRDNQTLGRLLAPGVAAFTENGELQNYDTRPDEIMNTLPPVAARYEKEI